MAWPRTVQCLETASARTAKERFDRLRRQSRSRSGAGQFWSGRQHTPGRQP